MIYYGSSNYPIYYGANEATIYYGSELIYPTTITGISISPASISISKQGGNKTIKLAAESDWEILVDTAATWITSISATGGTSGRSQIIITCGENTGYTVLTTSITARTTDLQYSATCEVKLFAKANVPNNQLWYHSTNNEIIYPMRDYTEGNSWWKDENENSIYVVSNIYDSTDGWCKMTWSGNFYRTTGTGFGWKGGILDVSLPNICHQDCEANWQDCTGITEITYGTGLDSLQGACWPKNIVLIYFYGTTQPSFDTSYSPFAAVRTSNGVIHYPNGSDYSSLISALPSGWTAIADL